MTEVEGDKGSEIQEQRIIPYDLITMEILTRLPIKTLMQFKLVSKQWNSTISSYDFGKLHFEKSLLSQPSPPVVNCLFIQSETKYCLFDYQKYEELEDSDTGDLGSTDNNCIVNLNVDLDVPRFDDMRRGYVDVFLVGSCNGLLCLASFEGKYFTIWNPSIHQWKKYEDPYVLGLGYICWASWGFGYVSCDDDYKVVRVLELAETLQIQVHVFSLRKNRWTRNRSEYLDQVYSKRAAFCKRFVATHGEPISFKTNHSVMVNETVYWIVQGKHNKRFVVAFDLVHEMFGIVPHVVVGEYDFLCDIGGNLSVFRVNLDGNASVSLLRQPGQEEVIPLYRVGKWLGSITAIGFTRADNFFVHKFSGEVGVFNPKSSEYSCVLTPEGPKGYTRIASFVQSVISPLTMAD